MTHRPPLPLKHQSPILRAGEIAAFLDAPIEGDALRLVHGPATLELADERQVAYVSDGKYAEAAASSQAGVLLVQDGLTVQSSRAALVRVPDARVAFQRVLTLFFAPFERFEAGTHPTASVAADAEIGPEVHIGPYCLVESGARIGARTILRSHVHLAAGAAIGEDGYLYPNVVIRDGVRVGDRCILHPGVVLGSDGFGFVRIGERHEKVGQIGTVRVGDDVEIGSNSCVDRGALGDTVIGSGTKIDNLVHVAHNVKIGKNVLLIAQVGISGSVVVEDDAILAGQSAIAGHLRIGRAAQIGGRSGVLEDIPDGSRVFGFPARPLRTFMRMQRALESLPKTEHRLAELEREVERLREALARGNPTS